ncbi:B3 domain-containing protein, DNA-binding pseudobarrel domain protein [Tanacetum coccineum]
MEKNVGNADRHDQNLTNEEVGLAASKCENDVNEGELYSGKIEEYVIEKKNNVYKRWFKPNHLKEFITSDEINGLDMKLVIQKTLHASDLKRNLNRLNMPCQQVETHDFLTYEEKQVLGICGRRKDGTKEIKVQIVGPNLQMHKKTLLLKIWRMSSTENYVLTTNWFNFVEENKNVLKEKTTIQVWSFRKDGKLCFAVVCVDEPGEHDAT